jgi:hypothetical protein
MRLSVIAALLLLTTACNPIRTAAPAPETIQEPEKPKEPEKTESEEAQQPDNVAGTYLTCPLKEGETKARVVDPKVGCEEKPVDPRHPERSDGSLPAD